MESKHELIIPQDNFPFKMFLFEGKDGNYKRASHWHRSIEIFLVLDGFIQFHVNAEDICLKPYDFQIVNSNEVHAVDAPVPNETLVLQIPPETFQGYFEQRPYLTFAKQNETENQQLRDLMIAIYQEYEAKTYAYELQVMGQFRLLQYLLLTKFKEQEFAPEVISRKKHLDKLSEITEYMQRHYAEELSLEKVADRFGFSPTYLSRIFRKYADISYLTYLMDLRVEYAVLELLRTDHEVGDIAVVHGFSDSRAFAKAFAKRYGCLPSVYRKKYGKKVLLDR
ncbi:MAG: AraC family transcriptional regulator [Hungatella sp.]